MTDPISQ